MAGCCWHAAVDAARTQHAVPPLVSDRSAVSDHWPGRPCHCIADCRVILCSWLLEQMTHASCFLLCRHQASCCSSLPTAEQAYIGPGCFLHILQAAGRLPLPLAASEQIN